MVCKECKEEILEWSYENNTIPMQDLHNIECICGHSLIEHEIFELKEEIGGFCNHRFCGCGDYCKNEVKSKLKLATTDGGWVNVLKLQRFMEDKK